jgi:hypothetical protein
VYIQQICAVFLKLFFGHIRGLRAGSFLSLLFFTKMYARANFVLMQNMNLSATALQAIWKAALS